MLKQKIIRKKISVSNTRKPLNTNNLIKTYDGKIKTAIFYKIIKSYILILFNENNQPTACWTNKMTKLPIHTKYINIKTEDIDFKIESNTKHNEKNSFLQILEDHKPKIIYANTCLFINNYIKEYKPILNFTNEDLSSTINYIKNLEVDVLKKEKISFLEAKKLDPTLTLKEYKKFLC